MKLLFFIYTVAKSWRSERPTVEMMHLIKYASSDGQIKEFRLLRNVQRHWEAIGILLGIHLHTLRGFELKRDNDLEKQCQDVLQTWLERGSEKYPVSWSGMLKVLEDVELKEISRKLQEALGK